MRYLSDEEKQQLKDIKYNRWKVIVDKYFLSIEGGCPRQGDMCILTNINESDKDECVYLISMGIYHGFDDDMQKHIFYDKYYKKPLDGYDFRDGNNNCWGHSGNVSHYMDDLFITHMFDNIMNNFQVLFSKEEERIKKEQADIKNEKLQS